MAMTEEEIQRRVAIDPTAAKMALAREVKIARANQSGMLTRTDSAGKPLYRATYGGNVVRTRPITQGMKRRILRRDGHACVQCGATDWLEIAHLEPYRVNGNNTDENLRTLCRDCHAKEDD